MIKNQNIPKRDIAARSSRPLTLETVAGVLHLACALKVLTTGQQWKVSAFVDQYC